MAHGVVSACIQAAPLDGDSVEERFIRSFAQRRLPCRAVVESRAAMRRRMRRQTTGS